MNRDAKGSEARLDGTLDALISAAAEPDSAKRAEWLKHAQIHALLSLRDAVQEATAVLKEITGQNTQATQDLERTLTTLIGRRHSMRNGA